MLYSDDSWHIVCFGKLCIAMAKDIKVTGSGWSMTHCPYILPLNKRPKIGVQSAAYAYPNANARIVISDETGKISVGSGDAYNIDSSVYACTAWVSGI